jgi:hypothetical protein
LMRSAYGPSATWCDVRNLVGIRMKADETRTSDFAIDP